MRRRKETEIGRERESDKKFSSTGILADQLQNSPSHNFGVLFHLYSGN